VTVLVAAAVVVAAAALRKRRTDSVLAIAATLVVVASAFAIAEDTRRADDTRAFSLAPDARWVDHSGLGAVSALVPRDALRWVVSEQLFWNRSVDRVLTLPGAPDADAFQNDRVHVDDRGVLRSGSRAVTGPLLVEEYAALAQLENARLVARVATTSLWAPQAGRQARFVSLTEGRYLDGWLGWPSGRVTVWPGAGGSRTGVLCLPLSVPDFGAAATQTVELSAPGYRARVTVPSGGTRLVAVPRTVRGPWVLKIAAVRPLRIGPRLLSVKVSNPRFVTGKASASACR
jgi:hypothetical protein